MAVDDDPSQGAVLGAHDARTVLVRRERGRAADEPREQRSAVRAHHEHGEGARARDAAPATRAPPRITLPAARRTHTAPRDTYSSRSALLTYTRPLSTTTIAHTHYILVERHSSNSGIGHIKEKQREWTRHVTNYVVHLPKS